MHEDLRRRALESKKTVSRRAISRQSSAATSPATSRAGSRLQSPIASPPASKAASQAGSDDEFDDYDDDRSDVASSVGFNYFGAAAHSARDREIDEELMSSQQQWETIVQNCIDGILDPKTQGLNQDGREKTLRTYIKLLREHYSLEEISLSLADLSAAFLKGAKSSSDDEAIQSLLALQVTAVTDQGEEYFEPAEPVLKGIIERGDSFPVRAEAIRALGIATFYSSGDEVLTEEVMEYLLRIIDSDACNIGADEDPDIVAAALEAWGLLASQLDDMEDTSLEPMEAFVEQLHNSSARVQIAAGQNICLLYEKSYTPVEENEAVPRPADYHADDALPYRVKRYEPFHKKRDLLETLEEYAHLSSKHVAKRERALLHTNFKDFVQSVEQPTLGPRYRRPMAAGESGRFSHANEDEDGAFKPRVRKGLRAPIATEHRANGVVIRVKMNGEDERFALDSWWKLIRARELQRVLKQGFSLQYEQNPVLEETLSLQEPPAKMPWGVHWAES